MTEIDFNALAAPFSESDIEWRIGRKTKDETKASAFAYITNRAVQNRLDTVCNPENWKNEKPETGPAGGVICGLSIRVNDEWITKWDGADNTNIEAVKGGLSDAMKRAAVQWGIGRYLYDMETSQHWYKIDEYGKWLEQPRFKGSPPPQRATAAPDTIDIDKFLAHIASLNLSIYEACTALKVTNLQDYTGTRQEASDALDNYIVALAAKADSDAFPEEEPAKATKPRKPHSAKILLKSLQQTGGTNGETLPIGTTQIKTLSIALSKYVMNSSQDNEVVFRYMLKQTGMEPNEAGNYSRKELWEPQADWFIEWLRGDPDTVMVEIENLRQHIDAKTGGSG